MNVSIGRATEARPLYRAAAAAPAFPSAALGRLRYAAEAIHVQTQAPLAMCGSSVLAAASLAACTVADVRLPHGQVTPTTCYFVTVAGSGERKSQVDKLATSVIRTVERERIAGWRAERRAARAEADPGTERDTEPVLLLSDATSEGIVRRLRTRPVAGLFSSEGGLFVGGWGMRDESKIATAALLNQLWDSAEIRRDRAGAPPLFASGRRLAAHVMIQPALSANLVTDQVLVGVGLAARLLVSHPDSTAGERIFRDPCPVAARNLVDYDAATRALLECRPRFSEDDPAALVPPVLEIAGPARGLWVDYYNETERQQAHAPAALRPFLSKAAEHAARLAGVLALFANPCAAEVAAEAMTGGIELARYFSAESARLADSAGVPAEMAAADATLQWLRGLPDESFHLTQVYQYGPPSVRTAEAARRALAKLEEHGYISRVRAGTTVGGAVRKDAWLRLGQSL